MKKKLFMSLVLVLSFGLLVGCGEDKDKTNNNAVNNGNNTNINDTNTNNGVKDEINLVGTYIADTTYDAEGVIILPDGDGYIVMIRDSRSTMVDNVDKEEIKDGKISSSLMREDYTIEAKNDGIVYNFPIYLVENLQMRRSTGKLDGIYENDTKYFIMFTLKNGEIRCYTYSKLTGNYAVNKIKSYSFTKEKGYAKGYLYDVSYDFKKSGDKLIVGIETEEADWADAKGEYTKIA